MRRERHRAVLRGPARRGQRDVLGDRPEGPGQRHQHHLRRRRRQAVAGRASRRQQASRRSPGPQGNDTFANMLGGDDAGAGPGHRLRRAGHGADDRCWCCTSCRRCSPTCRATSSTAIVQRTILELRAEVEDKLNRLPLAYLDKHQRGEVLTRVTNDIDNISQTLQQTLSQTLTSLLTVVGVLVMMLIISPLLALVALIAIPLSVVVTTVIAKRSQPKFIAQWRSHRRAQRPGRGDLHRAQPGQGVRPAGGCREGVRGQERRAVPGRRSGRSSSPASIMPSMMFIGNLTYVGDRRGRRTAGGLGQHVAG